MRICFFHLMPYRCLPGDFERRQRSVSVDVLLRDRCHPSGHMVLHESPAAVAAVIAEFLS